MRGYTWPGVVAECAISLVFGLWIENYFDYGKYECINILYHILIQCEKIFSTC